MFVYTCVSVISHCTEAPSPLLPLAGPLAAVRPGSPSGAGRPWRGRPRGCHWSTPIRPCPPRDPAARSPCRRRPPPCRWCSRARTCPGRAPGGLVGLVSCLYRRGSATRSQGPRGLRCLLPILLRHPGQILPLILLLLLLSRRYCCPPWRTTRWGPSQRSQPLLLLRCLLLLLRLPGNVQCSGPPPPRSQTPPGWWCCPAHT